MKIAVENGKICNGVVSTKMLEDRKTLFCLFLAMFLLLKQEVPVLKLVMVYLRSKSI